MPRDSHFRYVLNSLDLAAAGLRLAEKEEVFSKEILDEEWDSLIVSAEYAQQILGA